MTGWSKTPLPRDWPKRRAAILKRDPTCRIGGPTCTRVSTEVDHIDGRSSHAPHNLQGVCANCHRDKTKAEAAAGIRATWAKAKRKPEAHPGG